MDEDYKYLFWCIFSANKFFGHCLFSPTAEDLTSYVEYSWRKSMFTVLVLDQRALQPFEQFLRAFTQMKTWSTYFKRRRYSRKLFTLVFWRAWYQARKLLFLERFHLSKDFLCPFKRKRYSRFFTQMKNQCTCFEGRSSLILKSLRSEEVLLCCRQRIFQEMDSPQEILSWRSFAVLSSTEKKTKN